MAQRHVLRCNAFTIINKPGNLKCDEMLTFSNSIMFYEEGVSVVKVFNI